MHKPAGHSRAPLARAAATTCPGPVAPGAGRSKPGDCGPGFEARRAGPAWGAPGRHRPRKPTHAQARQAQETVQFRCNQPCWLDIRTADSGKRVFYKLLKGSTANFAVGSGLDVFSGRADLVKVRINDGAEEPLLSGGVVGSRVIRPSGPP